jgi:hypothetical protein
LALTARLAEGDAVEPQKQPGEPDKKPENQNDSEHRGAGESRAHH